MVEKLSIVRQRHADLRAETLPVASLSYQLEGDAMRRTRADISKQLGRAIQGADDNVDSPIVVEIRKGGPAIVSGSLEIRARFPGNILKAPAQIAEDAIRQ